jgi:hypothetical protein
MAIAGSLEQTAEQVRKTGREAFVAPMDVLDPSWWTPPRRARSPSSVPSRLLVNNAIYQGPGISGIACSRSIRPGSSRSCAATSRARCG